MKRLSFLLMFSLLMLACTKQQVPSPDKSLQVSFRLTEDGAPQYSVTQDGMTVLDIGRMIYDGGDHGDITVEGPKLYKREGKYWILCPAGSVKPSYRRV